MFLSNFFCDFFQFLTWKLLLKKNCCFQFFRSTLVAVHTMQQTVSIQLLTMLFRILSFCFLVKLFWQQGKSHFYSWLKKMKHSREFVLTKSLKAWIDIHAQSSRNHEKRTPNAIWASCKTQCRQWIIQGTDLLLPRSRKPRDALIVQNTIAS